MTSTTTGSRTDAVRLVDLRDGPLSVGEVLEAMEGPASGGVTLFVGRVRDHDGGRAVTGLEYAAHPTALGALRRVCAAVAGAHAVDALAAVHRLGSLAVGDVSVIVAASATHREESFAASRALIDQLKAEVPIWKHQRFSDGAEEWVGTP